MLVLIVLTADFTFVSCNIPTCPCCLSQACTYYGTTRCSYSCVDTCYSPWGVSSGPCVCSCNGCTVYSSQGGCTNVPTPSTASLPTESPPPPGIIANKTTPPPPGGSVYNAPQSNTQAKNSVKYNVNTKGIIMATSMILLLVTVYYI